MEDIEMEKDNNINIINNPNNKINPQQNEDSYSVLDNIERELKFITNTFFESLKDIKTFAPFISKGNETNQEQTEYNDLKNIQGYEENRKNFDNMLNEYSNQMNLHFNNMFDLTNKLKKFDEFNMKEEDLMQKLENLRQKNVNSTTEMETKLKSVEKILNELNMDQSMTNEINKREQYEQDMEYL